MKLKITKKAIQLLSKKYKELLKATMHNYMPKTWITLKI